MIRTYEKKDYETLCKWWDAWKWPSIPEKFLSDIGIISNDTAAGFLYTTNSAIAWIEWLVSDPLVPATRRSDAVDEVIMMLTEIAVARDFKAIFTSTNKDSLEQRLVKHGFVVTDRDTKHLFKIVGE